MARKRQIKPDFWTSDQIMDLDPITALIFIGIKNFSDDGGIHEYSPKKIKIDVAPNWDSITKAKILQCLEELEQNKLIKSYIIDDKKYFKIIDWYEDQQIDRPTYKLPDETGKISLQKKIKTKEQLNSDMRNFADSSRYRKDLKSFLIQRDGNECFYCGCKTITLTVDHVFPRDSQKNNPDEDNVENLVLACRSCNARKANRIIFTKEEWQKVKQDRRKGRRLFGDRLATVATGENLSKFGANVKPNKNNTQLKIKADSGKTKDKSEFTDKLLNSRRHVDDNPPTVALNNNSNIDINNNIIYNAHKSPTAALNNKNVKKVSSFKKKYKNSNYHEIPIDIHAAFDYLYNFYPCKRDRKKGVIAFANINPNDKLLRKMVSAIKSQKHEALLKEQAGQIVLWPYISNWLNDERWKDEVDRSTPKPLKSKSTSSKFADNVANAYQSSTTGGA